jgi:polysaccharide biosynthesis protein PslE
MIDIRSFRDLVRLFFIYRREFTLALIATVLLAVLGALVLPARYTSDARLLIKQNKNEVQTTVQVDDQQSLVEQSTVRDPILDEEKILTSASVVQDVAAQFEQLSTNASKLKSEGLSGASGGF